MSERIPDVTYGPSPLAKVFGVFATMQAIDESRWQYMLNMCGNAKALDDVQPDHFEVVQDGD